MEDLVVSYNVQFIGAFIFLVKAPLTNAVMRDNRVAVPDCPVIAAHSGTMSVVSLPIEQVILSSMLSWGTGHFLCRDGKHR